MDFLAWLESSRVAEWALISIEGYPIVSHCSLDWAGGYGWHLRDAEPAPAGSGLKVFRIRH